MSEPLLLIVKSSIFDRSRQLIIDSDFIQYDDRDSVGLESTKFLKDEIEGLRYGIKWINGYQFTIGRIYCLDIRNTLGKTIKLRLKSLYGIKKLSSDRSTPKL